MPECAGRGYKRPVFSFSNSSDGVILRVDDGINSTLWVSLRMSPGELEHLVEQWRAWSGSRLSWNDQATVQVDPEGTPRKLLRCPACRRPLSINDQPGSEFWPMICPDCALGVNLVQWGTIPPATG